MTGFVIERFFCFAIRKLIYSEKFLICMIQTVSLESRINEDSIDLIRWKMNNDPDSGLNKEEVEMSIEEYRRFLILKMENPRVPLAPTDIMDRAWHMHILDTRRYAEDCELMFGRFLHHRPSYNGYDLEVISESLTRAFSTMKSLYSIRFGHDPIAQMGGCSSACSGVDDFGDSPACGDD